MFAPGGPTFVELMRQALSSTDRGYDLLAPKFDRTPFRTPDRVLEPAAAILRKPGLVRRSLDVCCGTGAGVRLLRPLTTELVIGLDRSQGMLETARGHLASEPGATALWVRGDALEAPLRTGFDLITCFGAFGHILEEDEPRLVRAIRGWLVPGGRFAFYSAQPPSALSPGFWLAHAFNAAMRVRNALLDPPFIMYYLTFLIPRARALLEAEGFSVETFPRIAPEPYAGLELVVATLRHRG